MGGGECAERRRQRADTVPTGSAHRRSLKAGAELCKGPVLHQAQELLEIRHVRVQGRAADFKLIGERGHGELRRPVAVDEQLRCCHDCGTIQSPASSLHKANLLALGRIRHDLGCATAPDHLDRLLDGLELTHCVCRILAKSQR